VFHNFIKIQLRLAMIAKGVGFWDRQEAMANYSPDLIPIAAGMCGTAVPAEFLVEPVASGEAGAIFHGTLWQKIKDFINSPEGRALIMALLSLLLMFI
jgi:hypothetical protein